MTDVLTDPEELFPPRPGGQVDTIRRQRQAEADQLDALAQAPASPGSTRMDVPVADHAAELARARTFSVNTSSNPIAELLGRDDSRRNAVIMTLDEPVVISFSQQAADDPRNLVNAAGLSANGFTLPVNVPVSIASRSVIWCTATSSTATRVSVMSFSYAEG